MLHFLSPPFYNDYVQLPLEDAPVPDEIQGDLKFYPFFKDTLSVINGAHFNCCPSAANQEAARDCKGNLTQNCLTICGFDMTFYYVFSAADSTSVATVITDVFAKILGKI